MNGKTLVIYDHDIVYAKRLQEFLCNWQNNPFKVYAFTNKDDFFKIFKNEELPEIVLMSENSFESEIAKLDIKHIFILNETGLERYSEYINFHKYQAASKLFQEIFMEYTGKADKIIPEFYGNKKAGLIGVYTPVSRCMQTSFAMALSQILGKKGRTLYINFEQFSGFSKLFRKGYLKDLSDLVYYFLYSKDKFLYWLKGVVEHFGNFDYIPPVLTAVSLVNVRSETWVDMLEKIVAESGYAYVVLDLNESVQGFLNVLGMCQKIYTIERKDAISMAKLYQYEQILEEKQYHSIKNRVRKVNLPTFQIRNDTFEEIIYGELYDYVKKLVDEDFYESKGV